MGNRETKEQTEQKSHSKIIDLDLTTPIITLNVNGLNAPTKRHKLAE